MLTYEVEKQSSTNWDGIKMAKFCCKGGRSTIVCVLMMSQVERGRQRESQEVARICAGEGGAYPRLSIFL